jgi:general secretion pathway protein H
MTRTRRTTRPLDAGYTLLELAAVIAIVLILSVAAIATVQSVRKADISTSAAKLSAAVRYLYDLAVLNNRPYKLVIDFGGNAYWGDLAQTGSGCGTGLLPSDTVGKYGLDTPAAASKAGAASRTAGAPGAPAASGAPGEGGEAAGGGTRDSIQKDNLLTKRTLPKGISFSGVMTTHQDEPTEEGMGEVYFFPSGYVERAYIYLKQDEDFYTVETIPLKGTGRVTNQKLDARNLLDRT